jgi:hypothetical protein
MKLIPHLLGAFLLLANAACSPKENTSLEATTNAATASVFADFAQVSLPYSADTLLMSRMGKPITTETAAVLFRNVTEALEYEGGAYYFSRFLYLDSLYKANPNPTFDIGELVKVKAYALDQWKVSEQAVAITVLIDFQSYEADPYSAGQVVALLTCTPEGKPIHSLLIAERSGGGDPPAFGTTLTTATVTTAQQIQLKEIVESGEYQEDGSATMTRDSKDKIFRIQPDGKISMVSEKAQPQQTFQKPAQQ